MKDEAGEAGKGSTVYLKLGRWGESGGCAGAWKGGEVKVTSLRRCCSPHQRWRTSLGTLGRECRAREKSCPELGHVRERQGVQASGFPLRILDGVLPKESGSTGTSSLRKRNRKISDHLEMYWSSTNLINHRSIIQFHTCLLSQEAPHTI